MPVSLFSFVDLFARQLVTLDHLLAKGAEHAKANGVSEAEMLDWRLIGDMQPLSFQAMVLCNFTRQWTARAAGREVPASVDANLDLAGLRAAIAEAKAYLGALKPEQFAGRDDVMLEVEIGTGMKPNLPVSNWLTVFATTNLFFHLSTAYGILRHKGVPLGKIDFFASGL